MLKAWSSFIKKQVVFLTRPAFFSRGGGLQLVCPYVVFGHDNGSIQKM